LYSGSKISEGNNDNGSSIRNDKVKRDRAEPVLVLLSDLYSLLNLISISTSEPSSCTI